MKNQKLKLAVSWILVIIWASIIFNLSSKSAPESTVQSQGLITTVVGFFGQVIDGEEEMLQIDGIVRETAHGIEYFIFGALVFNALYICLNYRKQEEMLLTAETGIEVIDRFRAINCIICAILISSIYALSDEIHQISVPGRAFQLMDLFIDMIGAIIGIICLYMFFKSRENKRKKW